MMRLVLMVFGLMMVLTFGAITVVQSYTPAGALSSGDDAITCQDDGDDGAEEPDLPDYPDSEDNEEEVFPPGAGDDVHGNPVIIIGPGEIGDPNDDPPDEWDDLCLPGTEPGGVLGESATPSATPCNTPNDVSVSGTECCPELTDVDAQLIDPCFCYDGGGEVAGQIPCCFSAGPPHANICSVAGDADCDGDVTPLDAYATLVVLSGFEAGGCASGGDADCSGAVDPADTLAILKILAGVSEPATC